MNSDIYFDEKIGLLKTIENMTGKVLSQSRVEVTKNGTLTDLQCARYIGSHDTYIFMPPLVNFERTLPELNFPLGGQAG
jgi:hypothetical protein